MAFARFNFIIHVILFIAILLFTVYSILLPEIYPAKDDLGYEGLTFRLMFLVLLGGYVLLIAFLSWLVKNNSTLSDNKKVVYGSILFSFCALPILLISLLFLILQFLSLRY